MIFSSSDTGLMPMVSWLWSLRGATGFARIVAFSLYEFWTFFFFFVLFPLRVIRYSEMIYCNFLTPVWEGKVLKYIRLIFSEIYIYTSTMVVRINENTEQIIKWYLTRSVNWRHCKRNDTESIIKKFNFFKLIFLITSQIICFAKFKIFPSVQIL